MESADIVSPLERSHIAPALEAINSAADYNREWRFRRKDGSGFDADVHATRMPDGLLIATVRDVSERKQAEQRIARLNRLYSVLSGINSLIVRATERTTLFDEACRIAVEKGGFAAAWIGEIHDGVAAPRLAAWAGVGGAYREAVEATWRDRLPPRPGMEAVVTLGEPVIVNDLSTDARVRLRDQALASGIRALAVLPLTLAGNPVALFTLCAAQDGVFDADEVDLLLELKRDVSFALDHIEKIERLEYLGYYDALTGLANRSLLLERIAQFMRGAAGSQQKLGLLLIDLERFKNINDSLGQARGDQLLRQVAEWLVQQAGDAGLLARVGTDQFAMILPTATQELDVARLIETMLARLLKHPFRIDGTELRIAAKLGAALYPEDGEDAATLYKHAEAALKQAKVGGERALFYARKMTASVAERLALETQLRQALENREFVLHYQPKADLRTRRVTGAEALIRWNDPRTGLVPPFKFIPVLEATGLIHDVGRWAIQQALQDYLRWRAAGLRAVPIAVNVSSLQLRSPSFVDEIAQAIGVESGAHEGLQLEITESMIMGDIEASIVTLQKIRSMGISIALDDFGTGFSSLSYLARLPVTTIKIDRSFVVDMEKSASGESLIASMIQLSQSLRLKVVAEGVETEQQARLLLSHGCDELQGYLFGRPMPTAQFEEQFLRPGA
jgi:diguanylate cyclase (GGDEF)-like protein